MQAEVLPELQTLHREDNKEVSCLVIKYKSDSGSAETWVRASDGTVLRQEASAGGEKLILDRQ
jgi:hypothetical protein